MGSPVAPVPVAHRRALNAARAALGSRWGLYALAFLVHAALAPFFVHDWDGFVFITSVTQFLEGVTPYQVAEAAPHYIYLNERWPSPNSWFAYPPLALLIMTPALAVCVGLGVTAPALLRFALKLPMIAGHLALAWVVGKAVTELGGGDVWRRRAEVFILFNPFLIFVTAVWGMFDAWMMALLIASALLLNRLRYTWAGVAFGAAALVKIFPLLVSPLFFAWALRAARQGRDVTRFVGAAVATFAAVSLPFFLTAPQGFLNQTLLMHLERPLQGFTTIGLLYVTPFTASRFGFPLWPAPPEWVGPLLGTALLAPALALAYAYTATGKPDLRRLLTGTLVAFVLILLVSKVVNEQYLVMPLALFTILAFTAARSRLERAAVHAWAWGGFVAALLLGWHWLTFIPADVAPHLLGMQPGDALHGLGVFADEALGIHPDVFYVIPDVVTALAVVPAFVLSFAWVVRQLRAAFPDGLRPRFRAIAPAAHRVTVLVIAVLLATGPLVVTAANAFTEVRDAQPDPMPDIGDRIVGATYYTWWNNPSRDPAVPGGNWGPVALTPENGYYTTNGHRIETDVRLMREAGIDFAAVAYHGYDHGRYEVFAKVARALGLHFAPMVETAEVYTNPAYGTVADDPETPVTIRPTDAAADAVGERVRRALELSDSDAFLRFDGKPVVFVRDGHLVGPSWDEASKRALAESVLVRHNRSFQDVSEAWGVPVTSLEDITAHYPEDVEAFQAADRVTSDWRWALDHRGTVLWERVRAAAGEPVHLVSTPDEYLNEMATAFPFWTHRPVDGVFHAAASPGHFRVPRDYGVRDVLDAWDDQLAVSQAKYGTDAFATVHHAYNDTGIRPDPVEFRLAPDDPRLDGNTYAHFWQEAQRQGYDKVLISSWNNYFEGSAVAPTREYGREPLDATREHITAFKAREEDADRVLALVNEWGGLSDVTHDKKDWTFSLGFHLPWRLTQSGADVDVVGLNDPIPPEVAAHPLQYDEIWLEPGSGVFRASGETLSETHAILMWYVHHGGTLVFLGGGLPKPFEDAYLAEGVGHVRADPVRVEWDGGHATYPATDRYVQAEPHDGCRSVAAFASTGTPAAWTCEVGEGTLVATAFRPQGWDYREDPGTLDAIRLLRDVGRG